MELNKLELLVIKDALIEHLENLSRDISLTIDCKVSSYETCISLYKKIKKEIEGLENENNN